MLNKLHTLIAVIFLNPVCLFSASTELPTVIDYGTFPTIESGYYSTNKDINVWNMGGYAFNHAPELTTFFAMLKRNYQINTLVETGTYHGGTTILFSYLFDDVHTIEIQDETYQAALVNFANNPNVTCHLGSSEAVLASLLPSLQNKRVIFYLDAHWQSHWPLLEEIEEIRKTHKDNCIIVIDDFKVPKRKDIPFDRYGQNECSYEYVRDSLAKVYTDYTFHYLIPKSINSRAKFVAIPKQWAQQ